MNEAAINVKLLTKQFGRDARYAVNVPNMSVARGTVFGLIGKNGAGKTTLLRLLMGLLRPTSGTAHLLGEDMMKATSAHRARVAYVAQDECLPPKMSLKNLCRYVSYFYPRWDDGYARSLISRFELDMHKKMRALSGGQRRKAAVVLAFAARPDVLLLDEPAANLDPIARRELIDEIVDIISRDTEATVVLSTHIITDLERIAEEIGIMDAGRVVYSSPLEAMRMLVKRVRIVFDSESAAAGFKAPHTVKSVVDGKIFSAVAFFASEAEIESLKATPGARVEVLPLNLEDVFIELLGSKREASAEAG